MDFGTKKALVGAFGKRCILIGVPAILDDALVPFREKLKAAARGEGALDDALDARALRDALRLHLEGKRQAADLRKLYPLGLSPEAAQEILANMRLALNRATKRQRGLVAIGCGVGSALLFAGVFFTPLHTGLTGGWPMAAGALADLALLVAALIGSTVALDSVTRFSLRRRFPDLRIVFGQATGKTGLSMLGGIIALFALILALAPVKPAWVTLLLRGLGM